MEGVGTVAAPSVEQALRTSAALDTRFHRLRGDDVVTDKDRAFRALFDVLESTKTPYALIGGVAVQLWISEPRTTLDVDVAVPSYEAKPDDLVRAKLRAASDPARRRSKRLRDLADAGALAEERPEIEADLAAEERALLQG